ncbi:hypothetical protein IV102_36785 [bacterium]|nr:hypothetical protein [bacterium]
MHIQSLRPASASLTPSPVAVAAPPTPADPADHMTFTVPGPTLSNDPMAGTQETPQPAVPIRREAAQGAPLAQLEEAPPVALKSRTALQILRESAVVASGAAFHREEAYAVMDRFAAAQDPVTCLLPLHVRTQDGQLVPTDHLASGLDFGRHTAGLVMTAQVAAAQGDLTRAARYLQAAETNYARGKKLLAEGDVFMHRRDFNEDGSVKSTHVGEPGKSADGADDMTRVNPRAYAFRAAAELYQATGNPDYKEDFARYFGAWVKDFHDPVQGGFFVHANIHSEGDHTERGSFKNPGGTDSTYSGSEGVKGNDSTIYALSSVLLAANEVLATPQTRALVQESMDIILDKFVRRNGMLWENYTADFQPISQDWQNQPRENGSSSHVAIGGHTAMAAQQIIEGARQLKKQGAISDSKYQSYIDRTVGLFQDFASHSGALDWNTGAVHNAIRVEEPDQDKRWMQPWGDASWQQAELLQTLLRLREEDRLHEIQGPDGRNGSDLLALAEQHYASHYALPAEYSFTDYFGNPDVYHRPQVAQYFQQALSQKEGQ